MWQEMHSLGPLSLTAMEWNYVDHFGVTASSRRRTKVLHLSLALKMKRSGAPLAPYPFILSNLLLLQLSEHDFL